jgi:hypothetical protein
LATSLLQESIEPLLNEDSFIFSGTSVSNDCRILFEKLEFDDSGGGGYCLQIEKLKTILEKRTSNRKTKIRFRDAHDNDEENIPPSLISERDAWRNNQKEPEIIDLTMYDDDKFDVFFVRLPKEEKDESKPLAASSSIKPKKRKNNASSNVTSLLTSRKAPPSRGAKTRRTQRSAVGGLSTATGYDYEESMASKWWDGNYSSLKRAGWECLGSGLVWTFIPVQYLKQGFTAKEVKKQGRAGEHFSESYFQLFEMIRKYGDFHKDENGNIMIDEEEGVEMLHHYQGPDLPATSQATGNSTTTTPAPSSTTVPSPNAEKDENGNIMIDEEEGVEMPYHYQGPDLPATSQATGNSTTTTPAPSSTTVPSPNAETNHPTRRATRHSTTDKDDSRKTPTTHLAERIASYWWKFYLKPEGWKMCYNGSPWSFFPDQYIRQGFKVTEVKKKGRPGEHYADSYVQLYEMVRKFGSFQHDNNGNVMAEDGIPILLNYKGPDLPSASQPANNSTDMHTSNNSNHSQTTGTESPETLNNDTDDGTTTSPDRTPASVADPGPSLADDGTTASPDITPPSVADPGPSLADDGTTASPDTTPASVADPGPSLAESEPLLTATMSQPTTEASNSRSDESFEKQADGIIKTLEDKNKKELEKVEELIHMINELNQQEMKSEEVTEERLRLRAIKLLNEQKTRFEEKVEARRKRIKALKKAKELLT